MDAQQYIVMLQDKHFFDLKKMEYKYSKTAVGEMLNFLELQAVKELPLSDFTRQEKTALSGSLCQQLIRRSFGTDALSGFCILWCTGADR